MHGVGRVAIDAEAHVFVRADDALRGPSKTAGPPEAGTLREERGMLASDGGAGGWGRGPGGGGASERSAVSAAGSGGDVGP
jgi:hypothetical protein